MKGAQMLVMVLVKGISPNDPLDRRGNGKYGAHSKDRIWRFVDRDWQNTHSDEIVSFDPKEYKVLGGKFQCYICEQFTSINGGACSNCAPLMETGCGHYVAMHTILMCSECRMTYCYSCTMYGHTCGKKN